MKVLAVVLSLAAAFAAGGSFSQEGAYVHQVDNEASPVPFHRSANDAYVPQLPENAVPRPLAQPRRQRIRAERLPRDYIDSGDVGRIEPKMAIGTMVPFETGRRMGLPSVGPGVNVALPASTADQRLPSVGSGAVLQ